MRENASQGSPLSLTLSVLDPSFDSSSLPGKINNVSVTVRLSLLASRTAITNHSEGQHQIRHHYPNNPNLLIVHNQQRPNSSSVLCSSICMRLDSHTQFLHNCLRPFFFFFLFLWRCRFFRVFLYHYVPFSLCLESTPYVFPS